MGSVLTGVGDEGAAIRGEVRIRGGGALRLGIPGNVEADFTQSVTALHQGLRRSPQTRIEPPELQAPTASATADEFRGSLPLSHGGTTSLAWTPAMIRRLCTGWEHPVIYRRGVTWS
jgi:hypothetical protein